MSTAYNVAEFLQDIVDAIKEKLPSQVDSINAQDIPDYILMIER